MPEWLVPEQFAEIARLSDESRARDRQAVTAVSNPELGEQARALYEKERLGGTPREALSELLRAMSDESFKDLIGWVIFGRDYTPREGDPSIALGRYINAAITHPRNIWEMYLEEKPIGEYLRSAMHFILTTTSRDIERAQDENYEEDGDGEENDQVE
jgi:hypothetical protein